MPSLPVKKVNWWHEQIVDWELQNPDGTLQECAAYFDVGPTWLSTVRHSDAFVEYRARRIAEHQNMVSRSVIDKVEGLAHLTLDTLHERIEEERKTVSLAFLRETTDSALRALGYTSNRREATTVQVNINTATPESLARAREKMRLVAQERSKQIEGEVDDSAPPGRCEVPASA